MARRKAGRAYQTFKAKVRLLHVAQQRPCQVDRCLFPSRTIDYHLAYPHPQSWSLDHRVALHQGGHEFDNANTQASHLRCNQSRGASESNAKRGARRAAQKAAGAVQQHTSTRW